MSLITEISKYRTIFIALLLGQLLMLCSTRGLAQQIPDLKEKDIRQSFLAFINLTTVPNGIEGGVLNIEQEDREGDLWRSTLGFSAEFTLRDSVYDGYWGIALIAGGLNDDITLYDTENTPIQLSVKRDITALRGSFGLSFPMNQYFKIRPYVSVIAAQARNSSEFSRQEQQENIGNYLSYTFSNTAESLSGVATLDLLYSHWHRLGKLELDGHITTIYSDTFSEENQILDTWGWSENFGAGIRWSRTRSAGSEWQWHTFYNYSNYRDHAKTSLGFRYLNEVGIGMEYDLHIKPLDWFGWRYLGFQASYAYGDDVEGFNVGITVR